MFKETTIKATLTATTDRAAAIDALRHLAKVQVTDGRNAYNPVARFEVEESGELTIVLRHEELKE